MGGWSYEPEHCDTKSDTFTINFLPVEKIAADTKKKKKSKARERRGEENNVLSISAPAT